MLRREQWTCKYAGWFPFRVPDSFYRTARAETLSLTELKERDTACLLCASEDVVSVAERVLRLWVLVATRGSEKATVIVDFDEPW